MNNDKKTWMNYAIFKNDDCLIGALIYAEVTARLNLDTVSNMIEAGKIASDLGIEVEQIEQGIVELAEMIKVYLDR